MKLLHNIVVFVICLLLSAPNTFLFSMNNNENVSPKTESPKKVSTFLRSLSSKFLKKFKPKKSSESSSSDNSSDEIEPLHYSIKFPKDSEMFEARVSVEIIDVLNMLIWPTILLMEIEGYDLSLILKYVFAYNKHDDNLQIKWLGEIDNYLNEAIREDRNRALHECVGTIAYMRVLFDSNFNNDDDKKQAMQAMYKKIQTLLPDASCFLKDVILFLLEHKLDIKSKKSKYLDFINTFINSKI